MKALPYQPSNGVAKVKKFDVGYIIARPGVV
jgi:hypothetical protein